MLRRTSSSRLHTARSRSRTFVHAACMLRWATVCTLITTLLPHSTCILQHDCTRDIPRVGADTASFKQLATTSHVLYSWCSKLRIRGGGHDNDKGEVETAKQDFCEGMPHTRKRISSRIRRTAAAATSASCGQDEDAKACVGKRKRGIEQSAQTSDAKNVKSNKKASIIIRNAENLAPAQGTGKKRARKPTPTCASKSRSAKCPRTLGDVDTTAVACDSARIQAPELPRPRSKATKRACQPKARASKPDGGDTSASPGESQPKPQSKKTKRKKARKQRTDARGTLKAYKHVVETAEELAIHASMHEHTTQQTSAHQSKASQDSNAHAFESAPPRRQRFVCFTHSEHRARILLRKRKSPPKQSARGTDVYYGPYPKRDVVKVAAYLRAIFLLPRDRARLNTTSSSSSSRQAGSAGNETRSGTMHGKARAREPFQWTLTEHHKLAACVAEAVWCAASGSGTGTGPRAAVHGRGLDGLHASSRGVQAYLEACRRGKGGRGGAVLEHAAALCDGLRRGVVCLRIGAVCVCVCCMCLYKYMTGVL
jgi:hypothetical protein